MKRSRGRNRRSGGNNQNNHNNPNRHYESVGPDVKIRGSAQQVLDKYQQYARDAQTSGDRVLSEAYFQFAEHYQRIVAKQTEARDRQQQQRQGGRDNRRDDNDNDSNNNNDNNSATDNNDDNGQEAEVEVRNKGRDNDSDDSSDNNDSDEASANSESRDEAEESSTEESNDKPRPAKSASRTRRKPYAKRESAGADKAEAETDGVMKTLSRGRKKPAEDSAQNEETSAEATD